ncbi:MAG TPA: hypothetical protein VF989_08845 [Polyangiaceae bacterium]|jgi:hypothetical protein
MPVLPSEPTLDPGLRAANQALSGRRTREASRFASIELRFARSGSEVWEFASIAAVGFAAVLFVLGLWFL